MKSIYASKLYRSSSRKDKITAALVNSANRGLVQQLADSLDEQYQTKELVDPETALESQQGNENGDLPESLSPGEDASSFNPSTDLVSYPGGGGSGDGMFFSEEGEEGEASEFSEGEEDVSEEGEVEISEDEPEEVTESTKIKACTCLDVDVLNVMKDGLNSVQNTNGVTRLITKENELWIYYNDDINLNNIMTDVIDYVIQRCPGVDFNRLARSDNAIVFELVEGTPVLSETA